MSSTTRTSTTDNTPTEAAKGADERTQGAPAEAQPAPQPEPETEAVEAGENTEASTDLEPATVDTAPDTATDTTGDTARVPGASGFDLPAGVVVGGMEWIPADGDPLACPIGTALAAEMAASA